MTKIEMTEMILAAKAASGKNWQDIAEGVGMSLVWTTSACLGMNSMPEEYAKALCETLDLPAEVASTLQECPHKSWDKTIPTDP